MQTNVHAKAAAVAAPATAAVSKKCQHGRLKHQCRDCGGSSICEHKRIRSRCKDCGGSGCVRAFCGVGLDAMCVSTEPDTVEIATAVCEHGKRRIQCVDCKGASICQHGRRKFQCKECNGSAICMHNRRKGQCTICMGSSICEHSRRRSRCTLCGGSGVCEHRRRRSECKECRGSEVCSHLRIRSHCSECMSVTSAPNASAGTAFPLVNRASPSPKIKVQRARIGGASAAASDGFGGREDGGEDGSGGSGKFVWHDKKRQRKCGEQDVGCLRVDGREIPMVGGTAFVAPPLLPGLKTGPW